MGTEIRQCNCESEFQDKRYGKNMRVHNCGGGDKSKKYTCTVCGKVSK